MTIVGVLCWYDEQPSTLAVAVAGAARVCDTIVAVDGAYSLYPGARPRSHPDQAEAILAAAETHGVGCLVHRPQTVFFGNEVEKRNLSLALAGTLQPDWLLVFDADYQVMLADPIEARATLNATTHNVVTYTILDSTDHMADDATREIAITDDVDTEWTTRERGLFRWAPDLRYGPAHYCVRGTYHGDLEWLRGPDLSTACVQAGATPAPTEHLGRQLVFVHRRNQRPLVRRQAAEGYYRLRDEHDLELISPETMR